MGDNLEHIVTDAVSAVQQANEFATTFAHPAYVLAEDRLRSLSDDDVALVVQVTGGLAPVSGRVQALVRGATPAETPPAPPRPTVAEQPPAPTLEELCATVRITATPTDRQPPWQEDDAAPFTGQGWNVKLNRGELGVNYSELAIPFWMGEAHGMTLPTAIEVMDCLCSDAATIENSSGFDDWAGELGFSTDSRRAEFIFESCVEQCEELRAFLGDDYEAFIWAERD